MSAAALGLSFAAGALSTLSPCVLPLLPIVLASAASEHRLAPAALAAGLALSFTAIGLFVATLGFAIGVDGEVFRIIGALLLAVIGAVLVWPGLQERFSVAASPFGNWAQNRFGGFSSAGSPANLGPGYCSARSGAPAQGLRSGPRPCWLVKASSSAKWLL